MTLKALGVIALGLLSFSPDVGAQGAPAWVKRFHHVSSSKDIPTALTTDSAGNFIVAGDIEKTKWDSDIVLIKYSGAGVALWTNYYDGPYHGRDKSKAITTDENDNIYVTGSAEFVTSREDVLTLAYSSAGVPLWTNRFLGNGAAGYPDAGKVVVAKGDMVYVLSDTSYSGTGPSPRFVTLALTSAGVPVWTNSFTRAQYESQSSSALALGSQGEVFVTGQGNEFKYPDGVIGGYSTIAYSSTGTPMWTNLYLKPNLNYNYPHAMVSDNNGNIYLTGRSGHMWNNCDFATIAYSSVGAELWTQRYNGSGNSMDFATALIIGPGQNIYVTGTSFESGSGNDFATIAYTTAGVPLWTNRFGAGSSNSDSPVGIATDGTNIFVAGTSVSPVGAAEIWTIAYSQIGTPLWTNSFAIPGGSASATAIVYSQGRLVVLGNSSVAGNNDVIAIAYFTENQPPVSGGFGAATLRNQPLEMPESNLLAATSDPEGGAVSLFSVPTNSANGGTIAQNAGVITYTPPPGFVGADQFTYVVSDNQGATANVLARIAVLPPGTVIHAFATPAITPSTTSLNFAGAPGDTWSIYRAEQLDGPWTKIGAMTIPAMGLGEFQDLNSPGTAAFYRAAKP